MKLFPTFHSEGGAEITSLRPRRSKLLLLTMVVLWIAAISVGLTRLWSYENAPGVIASAPAQWPDASRINHASDRATLIMVVHPHCPCTRASIGELAQIMAHGQGRVSATVLFVRPENFPFEWEQTDLWRSAADIPGVSVFTDETGVEARRFGAATSGQTLLYDRQGRLLFSGGITASRGHSGDNAGRSAIVSLLTGDEPEQNATAVFGCPLFDPNSECHAGEESKHDAH